MRNAAAIAITVAIVLQTGCTSTPEASAKPLRITDEILSWLPADTETIVAVNQPGQFTNDFTPGSLAGNIHQLGWFGFPRDFSCAYNYIVDASRNYQLPTKLGVGHYEGCKIVSLNTPALLHARSRCRQLTGRYQRYGNIDFAVIENTIDKEVWTFYVGFDQPNNLMFCATDREMLKEILDRKANHRQRVALPETLPHWKFIDKDAAFWAVRKIPEKPGQNGKPCGCTLCMRQSNGVTLTILSDRSDARRIADGISENWLKREGAPPPLEISSVDETTAKLVLDGQAPKGEIAEFFLCTLLGHPIYL